MSWLKPALAGLFLALATQPALLLSISTPDPDDTFFHLSVVARVGLALLTFLASSSVLFLSIRKSEYLHCASMQFPFKQQCRKTTLLLSLLSDLIMTVLLYMTAVSLAPQLFYAYYLALFPSLSAQWVIAPKLSLNYWLEQIIIVPTDSLADQVIGVLFWTMMFACLVSAGLRYLSSSCSTARSS